MAINAADHSKTSTHAPPLQPIRQVFNTNISVQSTEDSCLNDCKYVIDKIVKVWDSRNDTNIEETIYIHSASLNSVIARFTELKPVDVVLIRLKSKEYLFKALKAKWVADLAKSFYSIPEYDDVNKRVSATEQWAIRFFQGAPAFACEETLSRHFVNELADDVEKDFYLYSIERYFYFLACLQRQLDSTPMNSDELKQLIVDVLRKKEKVLKGEEVDFSHVEREILATFKLNYIRDLAHIHLAGHDLRKTIWKEYNIYVIQQDKEKRAHLLAKM